MLTCPNTRSKNAETWITSQKHSETRKLSYKWGFPTKLIVTKDGVEHVMDTVNKGMALLTAWGIVPEYQSQTWQSGNHIRADPEWRTVTNKNARIHA